VSVEILEREMYSEAEAARLLRVPQGTLHYWLEGGERRGRRYRPVVRPEPKGTRSITWAEFIESALLAQYRREHGVPMAELRDFIEGLRVKTGVPYPLAHHQPFVGGRELVLEAQDEAGLDSEYWLVVETRGQLLLTAPSVSFVERVRWNDDGIASAWRPHADQRSPVAVDPRVRFGRPAVHGISTEALWEHIDGGESVDEVATAFDLAPADVHWAVSYESAQRAA
jgi:uncharacterized protein (DUF433 family)